MREKKREKGKKEEGKKKRNKREIKDRSEPWCRRKKCKQNKSLVVQKDTSKNPTPERGLTRRKDGLPHQFLKLQ
jgi:hypothetical protein